MIRRAQPGRRLALAAGLVLAGCGPDPLAGGQGGAYFLWAGVPAPSGLAQAETVYLLAGEVRHGQPGRLVPLRAVPRIAGPDLWLVVRTERLDWDEETHAQLQRLLRQWRAAGNRVISVQIDFDAATRGLAGYRMFLADLRRRLPPGTRLSVTGLLDWSANGARADLDGLVGVVDEIVVQTYQGRRTIPGYDRYLAGLGRLHLPYRVGIVADGRWREPAALRRDPLYRGTVEFLLAPQRR
ncbi:DUF3142 domain-containing protein [Novosphingobium aerophilum]|uniref:DUF3142 domain-containing protein n=1 Tax=Novosphingobium aerophilum TaxID=2839843 RepID=UPI002E299D7D|nr:DUF3142 domain-containing protein [Novosphingobium aerophilum]